jgi:hypothetical protein
MHSRGACRRVVQRFRAAVDPPARPRRRCSCIPELTRRPRARRARRAWHARRGTDARHPTTWRLSVTDNHIPPSTGDPARRDACRSSRNASSQRPVAQTYISARQIAERLAVSRSTAAGIMAQLSSRVGFGRNVRVLESDFLDWLARRRLPPCRSGSATAIPTSASRSKRKTAPQLGPKSPSSELERPIRLTQRRTLASASEFDGPPIRIRTPRT